jgi:PAS domain S-box-containing protein
LNPNPVLEVDSSGKIIFCNDASNRALQKLNLMDVGVFLPGDFNKILKALKQKKEKQFYREIKIGERIFGETLYLTPQFNAVRIYAKDITEHKYAEISLRKERDFTSAVLSTAGALVIVLDLQGRIVSFNKTCEQVTGYSFDEVNGKPFWNFLLIPEEVQLVKSVFSNLTAGQFPNKFENYWVAKDGTRRLIAWSNTVISDIDGNVEHIIGTGIDITERKQAEQALRKSKQRFEILSETAGQLLATDKPQQIVDDLCRKVMTFLDCQVFVNYFVDEEKQRLHLNAYAGIPEETARGIEWLDIGVAVCGCVVRDGQRIIAENIPESDDPRTDLVRSFGIKAYACHPLFAQGKVIGTLSFGTRSRTSFTDDELDLMKTVTDQVAIAMQRIMLLEGIKEHADELEIKVQERTVELSRINELLERMFSSIHLLVAYMDRDFNFIKVNKAYADAVNRIPEYFPGKNHFDLYPNEENEAIFRKVVKTGEPYVTYAKPFEYAEYPEWDVSYWDWNLQPVKDIDGKITGVVLSLLNVTDRIKAQQAANLERQRLYSVLENLPAYVCLLTADYTFSYVNQEFRKRFGEPGDRRCYEYLFDRKEPCEECQTFRIFAELLNANQWEWTGPDGKTYAIYDYPFSDIDGTPLILEMGLDITERKKAEEYLRMSENKYRSLMEQAADGIVLLDHNLNTIEVNTMACQITGYTREELLRMNTRTIMLPDEIENIAFSLQHVLSGETVVESRKLLKRDGYVITIEASVKMIQNGLIQVIFRDITKRKEAETQVAVTNRLLDLFTKTTSRKEYVESVVQVIHQWSGFRCVGIRVADAEGNIPYEAYTGFSYEFWKLENMLSLNKDMCACIRTVTGRFETQDASVLTPNGSFCINNSKEFAGGLTKDELARFRGNCIQSGFLSIVLVPIRYRGQTIGLIHLADERQRMATLSIVRFLETISNLIGEAIRRFDTEEALRKSEASLSEAQRIARVGNWEWDVNTGRLNWTDEVYRIFGLSPHQFAPTYDAFLGFVHPDDRELLEEAIKEAFYQKKPYAIDHRIVLPDGMEKTVHEQGEIVFDEKETPLRMVGTVQDITGIKSIENELRRSQEQLRELYAHLQLVRESERTHIAREIHDEFGTILTALKIDLSWLEKKLPEKENSLREKTRKSLDLINSAIKTVQKISSELRPGILDHLGLASAVEWQVKEFGNRTGMKWEISIDMGKRKTDRDISTTFFRILQETLTNIARHAEATGVSVSLNEMDSRLVLEVKDNGKGITEEQLASPQSYGLMGIKERIQYWGGEMTIRGIPNKGTTVTVSIPLGDEEEIE